MKAFLALVFALFATFATAQNVDSTSLPINTGIPVKVVKLFRVLAGQSITVYSYRVCSNQYAPPTGYGGYWMLNNTTQTDMYFVCESW